MELARNISDCEGCGILRGVPVNRGGALLQHPLILLRNSFHQVGGTPAQPPLLSLLTHKVVRRGSAGVPSAPPVISPVVSTCAYHSHLRCPHIQPAQKSISAFLIGRQEQPELLWSLPANGTVPTSQLEIAEPGRVASPDRRQLNHGQHRAMVTAVTADAEQCAGCPDSVEGVGHGCRLGYWRPLGNCLASGLLNVVN